MTMLAQQIADALQARRRGRLAARVRAQRRPRRQLRRRRRHARRRRAAAGDARALRRRARRLPVPAPRPETAPYLDALTEQQRQAVGSVADSTPLSDDQVPVIALGCTRATSRRAPRLDSLNELPAAFGEDTTVATTLLNSSDPKGCSRSRDHAGHPADARRSPGESVGQSQQIWGQTLAAGTVRPRRPARAAPTTCPAATGSTSRAGPPGALRPRRTTASRWRHAPSATSCSARCWRRRALVALPQPRRRPRWRASSTTSRRRTAALAVGRPTSTSADFDLTDGEDGYPTSDHDHPRARPVRRSDGGAVAQPGRRARLLRRPHGDSMYDNRVDHYINDRDWPNLETRLPRPADRDRHFGDALRTATLVDPNARLARARRSGGRQRGRRRPRAAPGASAARHDGQPLHAVVSRHDERRPTRSPPATPIRGCRASSRPDLLVDFDPHSLDSTARRSAPTRARRRRSGRGDAVRAPRLRPLSSAAERRHLGGRPHGPRLVGVRVSTSRKATSTARTPTSLGASAGVRRPAACADGLAADAATSA